MRLSLACAGLRWLALSFGAVARCRSASAGCRLLSLGCPKLSLGCRRLSLAVAGWRWLALGLGSVARCRSASAGWRLLSLGCPELSPGCRWLALGLGAVARCRSASALSLAVACCRLVVPTRQGYIRLGSLVKRLGLLRARLDEVPSLETCVNCHSLCMATRHWGTPDSEV